MKREEAKELLPVIQALAAGKEIQDSIDGVRWFDTDEINLEYEGQKIKHRIKPEPKYRPFRTRRECWDEMLKHQPFGWLKSKENEFCINIGEVSWKEGYGDVVITFYTSKPFSLYSNAAYREYTFADGAPFGVMEE